MTLPLSHFSQNGSIFSFFPYLLAALAGVAVSFSNSSFSENITTLSADKQLKKFTLAMTIQTGVFSEELL